jgi:hypothetical protein
MSGSLDEIIAAIKRDPRAKCTAYKVLNGLGCHHPRKRVIQYSKAVATESRGRGVLDTPLSRGMTA